MSILPAQLRICCFVVIIVFSGVVCGQETGAPLTLLDVLDVDQDGVLSAREITRSAPLIRRLDLNGDGRLTDDELKASDGDEASSNSDSESRATSGRGGTDAPRNAARSSRRPNASRAAIDGAINRAASFYMQKKYEEAGQQIERAQELIEQLVEDDDLDALGELTDSLKRFERARTLLTGQGVELPDPPDLTDFGLAARQPVQRSTNGRPQPTDTANAEPRNPGTVSFTKQVAPMLVKRCGGCHVKDSKGDMSFASYSALMSGAAGGEVIAVGNADSSLLIDMVEAGDMPPKGDPLPANELKLLRTWIDEGAVFDGDDEEAQLSAT